MWNIYILRVFVLRTFYIILLFLFTNTHIIIHKLRIYTYYAQYFYVKYIRFVSYSHDDIGDILRYCVIIILICTLHNQPTTHIWNGTIYFLRTFKFIILFCLYVSSKRFIISHILIGYAIAIYSYILKY